MKGRSKKDMRFAITGATFAMLCIFGALTVSSAAAVPIPHCPDTCIHDVDDPDPPSSGAT